MRYAMILKNRVIDVKESEKEPKYPPDIYGNKVTTIECSGDVSIGMIYDGKTGSFSEYEPSKPEPPQPTQLDSIEQTQLLIMEAMADQYEQRLETDLMMMDAQATTFEADLSLSEGGVQL